MTTWRRGLVFVAWLSVLAGVRSAFPELVVGKEIIGAIEQDATGRVWAVVRTGVPLPPELRPDGTFSERKDYSPERFCTWESGKWQPVAFHVSPDGDQGAGLRRLDRLPDGSIMGVWQRFAHSSVVLSRHLGDKSEILADVPPSNAYSLSQVLDSGGRPWIAGNLRVERIGKDAAPEWSHEFTKEDYFPPPADTPPADIRYDEPQLLPDSSGRVWAWGRAFAASRHVALKGLWLLDGELTHRDTAIAGLPPKPLMLLKEKNAQTLWACIMDDGLYEVNTQTLTATRVADPEPGAFRFVEQATRVGDNWCVVASSARYSDTTMNRDNVLWREREGRWECVLRDLDYWPQYYPQGNRERPLVTTNDGLWVGTVTDALWLIPKEGREPVHVDWHNGLPGVSVFRLFSLSDGSQLGVFMKDGYYETHAFCALQGDLLKTFPAASNVTPTAALLPPVQDARGHVWAVREGARESLSEWDGETWREYLLPGEVRSKWIVRMLVDSLDRIWVWERPDTDDPYRSLEKGPVSVFNPSDGKWQRYITFLDALKEQRKRKGFSFATWRETQPVFSEDQRIAVCVDWRGPVNYLKGSTWHTFTRNKFRDTRIDGLFFDSEGRLCVNTHFSDPRAGKPDHNFTFVLDKKGAWEQKERIPDTPASLFKDYPEVMKRKGWAALEALCPRAVVEDANEFLWYWYIENEQLYRRGLGISAPQFMPGEGNPLLAGYQVEEALLDPKGNTFLITNGGESFCLTPRESLPDTQAVLKEKGIDFARITLGSNTTSGASFVWRLDNGDWSPLQEATEVLLQDLIGGEHQFEAVAVDRFLQADSSPAIMKLKLTADPDEQIRHWIEQLRDPDYDRRKEAVAKLARYGALALPALQKARENASDDLRWWIDAAGTKVGDRRP